MFGPDRRLDEGALAEVAWHEHPDADANREQAMAARSFHIQKNLLRVAAGGSALLAVLFISIVAVNDWHDRMNAYTMVAMRTARALEEHALKVLQLNEALEQQVIDYLSGFQDDGEIARRQADVHAHLRRMAAHIPSVVSIYVTDAHGNLLASSAAYPVPYLSLLGQPYFRDAIASDTAEVSPTFIGLINHELLFNTTTARPGGPGGIRGVVSIAMRPRYFTAFYRDTVGVEPPWNLRLSRVDGAVLARYPSVTMIATAHDEARGTVRGRERGDRLDGNREPVDATEKAVLDALAAGRTDGFFKPRSLFDKNASLLAFRKVNGFPVFVSVGLPLTEIRAAWLRHMSLLAACLLLPCALLWGVIASSLRRLARGERDWRALQAEIAMRKGMEEAYRQSRKMESLGRLVGNVAHDFNNLLMVVSANAQVARFAGVAAVASQIAAIERAVREGQNLTRRLLGVAFKPPLRAEPVALRDWLVAREDHLREMLGDRVSLSWGVPGDWCVSVDPEEFQLVMDNVARNAREAMPHGGRFTIGASTRRPQEDGAPSRQGDFVCIALRDSGVGMEEAVLARAFEPLFSTKAEGRGMGLGLPQVFAFCDQAGGAVRIDSAPGKGTTVYLYLPREAARTAMVPVIPVVATPVGSPDAVTLRILLVEDDDAVAEANEELLMTMGHTVRRAASADQALGLFEEGAASAIDVVVSDIQMPGTMNGIDLAERLGRTWPALPVLLVTGYTRELERARRTNRPVFSKPFDIMALDLTLQRIGAGAPGLAGT